MWSKRMLACLGVVTVVGSTASVPAATAGTARGWVEPSPSVAKVELNKPAPGEPFNPANIGLISRSSKLLGKEVQDDFGRRLGTMEDVVVNLKSGRIVGCIVSADGDNKLVPPGVFFPVSEDRIVFNKERSLLRQAPSYVGPFSSVARDKAYSHFGVEDSAVLKDADIALASTLQGKSISGGSGKELGRVQDLALDVPKGAVVYVLAQSPEDRSQLQVVPPGALQMSGLDSNLALSGDDQRFLTGPKVPERFWTQVTVPEFAGSVYRHYGIQTANPEQALTPTGRSDEEIHSAVLSEVVNSSSLAAVNAKDLNISVKNGRVRLSGTVGSKGAREDIINFASRVVGAANVEDQLTVK